MKPFPLLIKLFLQHGELLYICTDGTVGGLKQLCCYFQLAGIMVRHVFTSPSIIGNGKSDIYVFETIKYVGSATN